MTVKMENIPAKEAASHQPVQFLREDKDFNWIISCNVHNVVQSSDKPHEKQLCSQENSKKQFQLWKRVFLKHSWIVNYNFVFVIRYGLDLGVKDPRGDSNT